MSDRRIQTPAAPRIAAGCLLIVSAAGLACGCGPRDTRFEILDYRTGAQTVAYFEEFDECYYQVDPAGNVDLVARRKRLPARRDGDPDKLLVQLLHVRTFFTPIPGHTNVESTMINTTVSYLIVSGETGASFEGGGFVSFSHPPGARRAFSIGPGVLTGWLESSSLSPQRRKGDAPQVFQRASVTGRFRATENQRQVVKLLNDMQRRLGPLPRYEPPPGEQPL
ncbi:MAG TPA: hypothetical protein VGM03_08315 [Phycisphaerae bacterium]|jgi:hypothetical protein